LAVTAELSRTQEIEFFIGDDGSNVNPVGGYYYTSMMEHQPGTVAGVQNTRNSDGGIVAVLER
jgi:hypothetical protein